MDFQVQLNAPVGMPALIYVMWANMSRVVAVFGAKPQLARFFRAGAIVRIAKRGRRLAPQGGQMQDSMVTTALTLPGYRVVRRGRAACCLAR
jgi:hypothetical protein